MKKILFIEDEPTLQKAIGRFLEKEGYEIIIKFLKQAKSRLKSEALFLFFAR